VAITTEICNSYKLELLRGVHNTGDVYKIALYTSAATLNKATTAYSATNETSGAGYTAGGNVLAGEVSALSGDIAYLDFNDPVWNAASFTARGALIYNATQANRAVASFDFGADVTATAGDFTVTLPAPGATAAVRVA
jgi:hypothetical protein